MDTSSFFKKILPATGWKLLAELKTFTNKSGELVEYWDHKEFSDFDSMAEAVDQFEAQGRTVYHACNSFGDWYDDPATGKKRIRTQNNAKACRSLYDDIDCGEDKAAEGKGYHTKKEAAAALKKFVADTGVPMPMVVDSGGGLHLYWPLTDDITPDEWRHLSGLKRRLTMHLGLVVDRACDMDTARVLRPIGSINKKRGQTRVVTLKLDNPPHDPKELRDTLEAAVERLKAPMVPMGSKPSSKNAFGAALERDYPDSYADIIAEHCATIRWFKETGAPDEPLWHKCIGTLKHCVDGMEKIHAWSAQYEGYDAGETERKVALWAFGPASCEVFKSCSGNKCDGCQAKCSTPVQLGYIATEAAPDIGLIEESAPPPAPADKDTLIKKLWNERVRIADKTLEMSTTQNDGTVEWTRFSEAVFYPVDLIRNEEGEWEVTIEYLTRYGKRRQFQMPTSHLASTDKMAGTLAAHTIFLIGKNGRSFAMSHLMDIIIGLQEHRQEVVTEEAFGWNAEANGFIIGNKEINEEGVAKEVRMSERVVSSGMAGDYGVSGTRNDWVRLVDEVYNRPGAEPYQFAFLVAAASPLIAMAGIDGFHGLPVAYTGDGGRGKTTACELACSIWGRGEMFKQSSNKGGTTINALLAKTAIMRHLPWVMDELTGQKTEEISDMLYALSNGQGKSRLNASGHFASGTARWDLFSFVTGNMDITGLLANLDRQMAEAVSVRCFEIKVPADINETVFKGVNFKSLVDVELRQHYGVVGRELLRLYMKNRAKIVGMIHKARQEYNPRSADETRERFYIDLICFALVAGKIMKSRDLIRFDLDAIKAWAFDNVKALRRGRVERQFSSGDMVADFISYLHEHTIVTKGLADMRHGGTPEVPLETLRGEPLARKVTGDKRFYVAARAFQVWGKENNVAPSALRDSLDKLGYIVRTTGRTDAIGGFNLRLGQGTTRTTGLARCFELDYKKLHGLHTEEVEGNVVPISSAKGAVVAEPVASETEAAA